MERHFVLAAIVPLVMCAVVRNCAEASTDFKFKEDFIRKLAHDVPLILKKQDPKTGRFGTGIWIVNDQNAIYPLAVAWATESKDNPYYHDPKLLDAIMAGGDALIEDMDSTGQWEFRKKDGSTWGQTYMPWTYSRWIRAFGLIKDSMPPERRKRWEKAILLGCDGISTTQLKHVQNIPAHQAMALYRAGQIFNRKDWCEQAKEFMKKVVAEQDPGGFWTENYGPVVMYNFVYVDALGTYYAMSRDETVRPALERAAEFHAAFTYPDGSKVETVDERNPYQSSIVFGNVGFSFTPEGRGYLQQQLEILKHKGKGIDPDNIANFILYGEEGPISPTPAADRNRTFESIDHKSLIRRKGDWFICLSAYHCPVVERRWIQDRQNLVSIFNDRCGLIIGGGNTKLQPLWSNFTVGDTSLLHHKPGDTDPVFTPPAGLLHIPSGAVIEKMDPPGLMLRYGEEQCEIRVEPVDDTTLMLRLRATIKSGLPVAAHITLLPHFDKPLRTQAGVEKIVGKDSFTLSSKDMGEWIEHGGWRLTVPEGATLSWPVLPHDPYTKDGHSEPGEGRIVLTAPFTADKMEYTLTLKIMK